MSEPTPHPAPGPGVSPAAHTQAPSSAELAARSAPDRSPGSGAWKAALVALVGIAWLATGFYTVRANNGEVTERTRAELAVEAYTLTAGYDAAISNWLRKNIAG